MIVAIYQASVRVMRHGRITMDLDTWTSFDPIPDRVIPRPNEETFMTTGGETPRQIEIPTGARLVSVDRPGRPITNSASGEAVMMTEASPRKTIVLANGEPVGSRLAIVLAIREAKGFHLTRPVLPTFPPVVIYAGRQTEPIMVAQDATDEIKPPLAPEDLPFDFIASPNRRCSTSKHHRDQLAFGW